MTLFKIVSDLHLEFDEGYGNPLIKIPYCGEDYLILAGDIQTKFQKEWFLGLLKRRSVLYIAGNHEFYGGDFKATREAIPNFEKDVNSAADSAGYAGRLIFLDNNYFLPNNDILVIGSTLWSRIDPKRMFRIHRSMNDYRIKNGNRLLTPKDTVAEFEHSLEYISSIIKKYKERGVKKVVVITHHAPSEKSTPPAYKGSDINSAYNTDLEFLMGDVDLWVHGHTHNSFDYKVGGCRVVCNPRGYIDENSSFDPYKKVEI